MTIPNALVSDTGSEIFPELQGVNVLDMERATKNIDEWFARYMEEKDERLLAITSAMYVENIIDKHCGAIFEKWNGKKFRDAAPKENVLRAMHILPEKLLSSAKLIRNIRNTFVHNLEKKTIEELGEETHRRIDAQVKSMTTLECKNYREKFRAIAMHTITSLYVFLDATEKFGKYIRTEEFRKNLDSYKLNSSDPTSG